MALLAEEAADCSVRSPRVLYPNTEHHLSAHPQTRSTPAANGLPSRTARPQQPRRVCTTAHTTSHHCHHWLALHALHCTRMPHSRGGLDVLLSTMHHWIACGHRMSHAHTQPPSITDGWQPLASRSTLAAHTPHSIAPAGVTSLHLHCCSHRSAHLGRAAARSAGRRAADVWPAPARGRLGALL